MLRLIKPFIYYLILSVIILIQILKMHFHTYHKSRYIITEQPHVQWTPLFLLKYVDKFRKLNLRTDRQTISATICVWKANKRTT